MARMSPLLALLAIIATSPASPLSAKGSPRGARPACATFLVGNWGGAGEVTGFGPPTQVVSTASYKSDRTFRSSTRYLGRDKKWTEQKIAGNWSATPGKKAANCTLVLRSGNAIGESSSTSNVTIVDADTYSAFGVRFKRTR